LIIFNNTPTHLRILILLQKFESQVNEMPGKIVFTNILQKIYGVRDPFGPDADLDGVFIWPFNIPAHCRPRLLQGIQMNISAF